MLSSERKQSLILSYVYGISIFVSGISWIYVSIYYYGGENLTLSILITVSLIMFLSLLVIPIGLILNKSYKDRSFVTLMIVPSVWVALELLRSIIFGGFPWLIVGHSQIGTLLDIIYPIAGSYFVSFLVVTISIGFVLFFKNTLCNSNLKNIVLLTIAFNLLYFYNPVWSKDKKDPLEISVLQPNINLGLKYDYSQIDLIKKKILINDF